METLANTSSYELTSTVEELDTLRDVSKRPKLEKIAVEILETSSKTAAMSSDIEATLTAHRFEGALDTKKSGEEGAAFRLATILRVTLGCWFSIFRCGALGLGAGGFALLMQNWADGSYPLCPGLVGGTGCSNENDPSRGVFYIHYIIAVLLPTIVSFIESVAIYYDLLRTSLAVARFADVKLYPMTPVRTFVCNSIVAEVFELGHPSVPRFGIDPLRGSNKYILKLYGALYNLRGGMLKFVLKMLLKKVATRSALRGASALLSLPIGAYLDAAGAMNQLAAVRTVALGRSFIIPVVDALLGVHQELSRLMAGGADLQKAVSLVRTKSFALSSQHASFDQKEMPREMKVAILRTIAIAVVQSKVFHPNQELMMKHIMFRLRVDPADYNDLDDENIFLKQVLPNLRPLDQYTVLTFMAFAVCLDGSLSLAQKINIKVAQVACNLTPSVAPLRRMSDKFNSNSITPQDVVFAFYKSREREEGNADITRVEMAEALLASIFKALAL